MTKESGCINMGSPYFKDEKCTEPYDYVTIDKNGCTIKKNDSNYIRLRYEGVILCKDGEMRYFHGEHFKNFVSLLRISQKEKPLDNLSELEMILNGAEFFD